jgi:hypothetical protein
VLRDGSALMSYGPDYSFSITPADFKYGKLEDFLVQKVPGATYDVDGDAVNFTANGRPIRPRFIVDKKEDVFERIDYYKIPMSQVISVSVRQLIGPPSLSLSGDDDARTATTQSNDVFVVLLSLKPGAFNQDDSKITTEVNGYYEGWVFYSPNYAAQPASRPDARTTIHWQPFIKTDEHGKASVNYYNADPKTTIRVDVQGLSSNGTTVAETITYQVK